MVENSDQTKRPEGLGSGVARLVFFAAVGCLTIVQLFVTFRGLATPDGMDQAQIARELARGNGYSTQVIRPYAAQQLEKAGKETSYLIQRDTLQPPIAPLVLALPFKLMKDNWECSTQTRVYVLDRLTAGISLVFFLGAMAFTWLTVQRLFDGRIAMLTVLQMLVCQLLWDVARGSLAPMLVLFFLSIALYWFVIALERQAAGLRGIGTLIFGMGVMAALMLLSHWIAVFLVMGLVVSVGVFIRQRVLVLMVVVPVALALAGWSFRNYMVCGETMGVLKATLQSALMLPQDSWLLRDYSGVTPPVSTSFLLRKVLVNLASQLGSMPIYLGGIVAAPLFFLALLHPFKRLEARQARWALAILWVIALVGMSLIGLPEKEKDGNQMYIVLAPMFAAYGTALFMVFWSRLNFMPGTWWGDHGVGFLALMVTAAPMAISFPTEVMGGLSTKGQFAQWPPYLPDRLARLKDFTEKREIVVADVPWAVAWYADRPSIWLPMQTKQFMEMREQASQRGESIAGLVFTPWSARVERIGDLFDSSYLDWAPQVLRGMGTAFGVDTMNGSTLPYREFFPLAGQPVGNGERFIAEMVFMADKKRW